MYIMNLIVDICLTKNCINNTPRWKFISKNKQLKKLNDDIYKFKNLDIFSASDNMITFLLSLDKDTVKHIDGSLFMYSDTFLCMDIEYNNDYPITSFSYYPKSNRFEVWNEDVGYTVYRNTKISNRINKMWEPLTDKIKERYLEIIIQAAEYITKPLTK